MGKNIVEGLWNGIKNALGWIKQKVGEFAKAILDGMKNALGIHSPSTLFRDEIGKFIPAGVAVGVEANTDEAIKSIDDMNNAIISQMNEAVIIETAKINAKPKIESNNNRLTVINIEKKMEAEIDMDKQKVGRAVAQKVVKTIRINK